MTRKGDPDVDALVERLLADPAHLGHPLRDGLSALWEQYLDQLHRLDRLTRLSDRFQSLARRSELTRTQQFEKQLKQLEKVTRISDRYQEMMRELNVQLVQASTHDLLTGLPNRRLLAERLKQEADRSERQEAPLCVALIDVDRFKQVNDTFGHDIGDEVLRAIGQAIKGALRDYDLCGRWGGEEFLLLLPATPLRDAQGVMARVASAVRGVRVAGLPEEYPVRVSIGLTAHHLAERPENAVSRADAALLEAKRAGRDRVVTAE